MAITLPSAEELDQYSAALAPRTGSPSGIPLIADDEAVCEMHVLETGSSASWSRGDVDVHVLHARQHRPAAGLAHIGHQAWLAHALRERREQRRRLLLHGVQTTASGLVVLHAPALLVVPTTRAT